MRFAVTAIAATPTSPTPCKAAAKTRSGTGLVDGKGVRAGAKCSAAEVTEKHLLAGLNWRRRSGCRNSIGNNYNMLTGWFR